MSKLRFAAFLCGSILPLGCQSPQATTAAAPASEFAIAFWNVENLFDADDDPANPGDDEFLPSHEWTAERYHHKLEHLAAEIATEMPGVMGFAEVENRRVLDDLFALPGLAEHGWQIAHIESPDTRGIDLALAFRAPFERAAAEDWLTLHPVAREGDKPSRGVLEVRLRIGGTPLTVLVNHWPSRGGDKDGSYRTIAGKVCRRIVDATIAREGRAADIVIVGDLNDDPFDKSVTEGLGAVRSRNAVMHREKGSPLWDVSWSILGQTDLGTLYYNPEWTWNVFDQLIVSRGMLDDHGFAYVDGSLRVHAPDRVRDDKRRPLWFRKSGDHWTEGFSDHFMIVAQIRLVSVN